MDILGQVLGGMTSGALGRRSGGGGLASSPVVKGLLIALAAKAASDYMRQRGQGRSFDPAPQAGDGGGLPGGLGSILGGGAAGGGLGSILGGLGGAGALGSLLGQLRGAGLGHQVDSWIKPGANQQVQPHQLADALGEDNIQALTHETGMPREALLQQLAQTLPQAVDQLTPDGREPVDDDDLHRAVGPT